jgi:acetyltransferase-like isoleucine patch superfamily enzyme
MNPSEDCSRGLAEKGWSKVCSVWAAKGLKGLLSEIWMRFWMLFAGMGFWGRMATRLAAAASPPYYGRTNLSWFNKKGYVSAAATIHYKHLQLGNHVFIDDGVVIFQGEPGDEVILGDRVHLYRDVIIQTGSGGRVVIGDQSCIHPRSIISAYKGAVLIGKDVQVAANCAFYPYNHGMELGIPIMQQPVTSHGNITVGDGAWIGTGTIVLANVCIGNGAVIGAGSVVTGDVPDNAIAYGVPARVIKMRGKS